MTLRHNFRRGYLLSFDAVLKVQTAQGRYSYALVSELPVEVHGPLPHCQTRPFFERERTDQELYMVVRKLSDQLSTGKRFLGPECGPAHVLNFVTGKVQSLSNVLILNILRALHCRLC